jgi:hypothetical protein
MGRWLVIVLMTLTLGLEPRGGRRRCMAGCFICYNAIMGQTCV